MNRFCDAPVLGRSSSNWCCCYLPAASVCDQQQVRPLCVRLPEHNSLRLPGLFEPKIKFRNRSNWNAQGIRNRSGRQATSFLLARRKVVVREKTGWRNSILRCGERRRHFLLVCIAPSKSHRTYVSSLPPRSLLLVAVLLHIDVLSWTHFVARSDVPPSLPSTSRLCVMAALSIDSPPTQLSCTLTLGTGRLLVRRLQCRPMQALPLVRCVLRFAATRSNGLETPTLVYYQLLQNATSYANPQQCMQVPSIDYDNKRTHVHCSLHTHCSGWMCAISHGPRISLHTYTRAHIDTTKHTHSGIS